MQVTRKLHLVNWECLYRVNGDMNHCISLQDWTNNTPVKAISQEMYDWKKELLPVLWLFDTIVRKQQIVYFEIIDVKED